MNSKNGRLSLSSPALLQTRIKIADPASHEEHVDVQPCIAHLACRTPRGCRFRPLARRSQTRALSADEVWGSQVRRELLRPLRELGRLAIEVPTRLVSKALTEAEFPFQWGSRKRRLVRSGRTQDRSEQWLQVHLPQHALSLELKC